MRMKRKEKEEDKKGNGRKIEQKDGIIENEEEEG